MALDQAGHVLCSEKKNFQLTDNRDEQNPEMWWSILIVALKEFTKHFVKVAPLSSIRAISVTSTSGTIIPVNRNYEPLHAALMYSDKRSINESALCSTISAIPINPSYGLPKMLWFKNHYPEQAEHLHLWCHAADFIIGKLSEVWGITDYTNALKSGYNLEREEWPEYISTSLEIPSYQLPRVVPPGTVIGQLSKEASTLTGLPNSIKVVLGMTDGCASQVASGCTKPGDWNTTIGTTLVIKGITYQPVHDPLGRIYNHKHPQGYWMPGGASNTGADWITRDYNDYDLQQLNQQAESFLPTPWLSYPLTQAGERFPFLSAVARGFDTEGLTIEQRFAARLEGVAYIERLSYECVESLSSEKVHGIYTAGGGSLSDVWLNIRSNILQKPIYKMKHVEGAVGAAMIAASQTQYLTLGEAVSNMAQVDKLIEPGNWQSTYNENYYRFKSLLQEKGYIPKLES